MQPLTFNISYRPTSGTEPSETDLLPASTLAERFRLRDNSKEKILLQDKLSIALSLVISHIRTEEEKDSSFYGFLSTIQAGNQLTDLEIKRQKLVNFISSIINDVNKLNKVIELLKEQAVTRRNSDGFLIPMTTAQPHNFETITDEQIATFFQVVVVNDLDVIMNWVQL